MNLASRKASSLLKMVWSAHGIPVFITSHTIEFVPSLTLDESRDGTAIERR